MSDLAEIAAAAGIAIIDSEPGDGGDMKDIGLENQICTKPLLSVPAASGDCSESSQIQEWDLMFHSRYTDADPEYAHCVETAEMAARPPCIQDFNCRRHRNDSRNWARDSYGQRRGRGDQGGYRNRGNYHNDWNRRDRDDRDGRGRTDYNQYNRPRDYGDSRHHGYGDQRHRGYGDQRHQGYGDQRGYGDQQRQGYRDRDQYSQRHGHQNERGYGDQRSREGNGEERRDRSPQR